MKQAKLQQIETKIKNFRLTSASDDLDQYFLNIPNSTKGYLYKAKIKVLKNELPEAKQILEKYKNADVTFKIELVMLSIQNKDYALAYEQYQSITSRDMMHLNLANKQYIDKQLKAFFKGQGLLDEEIINSGYTERQLLSYDPYKARGIIIQNNFMNPETKTKRLYSANTDVDQLLEEVEDKIVIENGFLNESLFMTNIIRKEECGIINGHKTDYLIAMTIPHTNHIVKLFPTTEEFANNVIKERKLILNKKVS